MADIIDFESKRTVYKDNKEEELLKAEVEATCYSCGNCGCLGFIITEEMDIHCIECLALNEIL